MKKFSKIALLVLVLAFVCAGIVMSVSGAEEKDGMVSYVDAKGNVNEGTLVEAWEKAANGTEITFLGNVDLEEKLILSKKSLTVNIGKYKLVSTDVSAFELKTGASLVITGSGKIEIDGTLVTSKAADVTCLVEGTAGTKGIDIYHTGYANNRIVYAEYGSWTFKNLDIISDAQGKRYHSFFEMKNVANTSYTCDVDFTFDTVSFVSTVAYWDHPGQFIVNVAGTGHLAIENSSFKTEHSAIKSGISANPGEEVISIKNSLISCSTDNVSVSSDAKRADGTAPSARNYAIYGYDDNNGGSPKGILNIEDSHLEANYRVICYENKNGEITENVANIKDSTVKCLGLNGNDSSENFARAIMIYTSGDTAFISIKKATVGATGTKQPFVVAQEGTRTNIYDITTDATKGGGIMVVEKTVETKNDAGEVTKVEYEYEYSSKSKVYAWVYDPVGNPDAPYVLVKRTFSGDKETTFDNYADAHKFLGFETYQFRNKEIDKYDEYLIWKDGVKSSDLKYYEPMGTNKGIGNDGTSKEARMKNFQIEFRGGAYYIAGDNQNRYMKYWIEPDASNPDAKTKTIWTPLDSQGKPTNNTPFWILGEMNCTDETSFWYARTAVRGKSVYDKDKGTQRLIERKSVIVLDFDFGTDTGIYPNLTFNMASRGADTSNDPNTSPYDVNVSADGDILAIKDGNKVTSNIANKASDPKLNETNMWNHMSVVFYTDPNYEGGLAYVYLNGVLLGTHSFYKGTSESTYVQGIRINVQKTQMANGSFCLDNVSLRSYNNYLADGEADGAKKNPEYYVTKEVKKSDGTTVREPITSAGTYIDSSLSVVGNSYRGASVSELKEKANNLQTYIRLQNDFSGSVLNDASIYSNGHKMNPAEGSYAANVVYDDSTGSSLYDFNKNYNALSIKYYWYIGEHGNAEQMKDVNNANYYYQTSVAPGQTPEYTGSKAIASVKDIPNCGYKVHCGWHSVGDDFTVEVLSPVTISAAIAQAGEPIYLYPSYELVEPTAYIKSADGVVDVAMGALEASTLLSTLKDGQTFVVCEDFQLDNSKHDIPFKSTTPVKMAIDLNGHTIKVGHATKRGSLIRVDSNVTFSVYSSQPGGMLYSAQGEKDKTNVNGNRIIDMYNGTESGASGAKTTNAHIVVGTVEVDGKVIPGSNLTLYGCVLVEARTGDSTCSVTVDGIRAIRHNTDSAGAFMTRFYSGTFDIKNTVIIAPNSTAVISLKKDLSQEGGSYTFTPKMRIENSVILNNGSNNILENTGDDPSSVCLTLKNVITNGRIETSSNQGKVSIESGVYAKFIQGDGAGSITYASGIRKGKYNQPMTLDGISDSGILEILVPKKSDGATMVPDAQIHVYVENGKSDLAPVGDNVTILELPILAEGTGISSDVFNVAFYGLDGNLLTAVEQYVKGGLPTIPEMTKTTHKISDFTTLVYKGEFDKVVVPVQSHTTFYPLYDVVNEVKGVQSSVSFYTSFDMNVYVPYEYKSFIKRGTANGASITLSDVTVDGVQYVMCSASVSPNKFTNTIEFVLEFDEMKDGKLYTSTVKITTSVLSYAKSILEDTTDKYTAKDKQLVYSALNYANEVKIYAYGVVDQSVQDLVDAYADLAIADSTDNYANAVAETNLADAFVKATVRLDSAPSIVFTLKRDFVGVVKFTIGDEEITYTVNKNSERTIILKNLTIASFTSDIAISVEGRIGTSASVAITDGKYNLATYAKHHLENGSYDESDIPTDSQLASKKAVTVIDAMFAYSAAAKLYAAG